jgi:basic membrane protein A and related proteins
MIRRCLVLAGVAAIGFAASITEETDAAKQLTVGYVTYAGDRQDRGVGQAAYEGFLAAVRRLGLEGRVVEVPPFDDPKPALMMLARQRYDLILDAAPSFPSALFQTARAFPKARFLVDGSRAPDMPKNVQTYVLRVQEAAYLAGYLAALMEKARPGKDVVGSVGGEPYSPVDTFIAGYRAGARKAAPGVMTLNSYSHDFVGPAKCRSIALSQISRGAGVIFNVAGRCGLGALDAAKAKHVWGIGVDIDQSFLGPHILTSVVKRYDVAIYAELRALKEGRFRTGGTTSLGLEQNGVDLGRISPKVPRAFVRELEVVRRKVAAGTIVVPTRIS